MGCIEFVMWLLGSFEMGVGRRALDRLREWMPGGKESFVAKMIQTESQSRERYSFDE